MSLTASSPNWRPTSSPAVAARIASRRSVVPPGADRRPCGRRAGRPAWDEPAPDEPAPDERAMDRSLPMKTSIHSVWTICIVGGMSTLTCHLVTRNPDAAAAWYGSALGAEETSRITLPGGQVLTIELRFGDSTLAISDEFPDMGVVSPLTLGGTYGALHDAFWGMRTGQFIDPFGHRWAIDQHVRDVPHEEVVRLAAAAFGGNQ